MVPGDFGLHVARYNSTLPTFNDGGAQELQSDINGRLIISGRYLEDSPHTTGDAGIFVMGVRNDTNAVLTSADGDYTALSTDSSGRLKVVCDLSINNDFAHAEDAVHTSGDIGAFILGVRNDNDTVLTSADGDYSPIATDSTGRVKIIDGASGLTKAYAYTVTDDESVGDDGLISIGTTFVDVAVEPVTSGVAYIYGWQWMSDVNAQGILVSRISTGGSFATGTYTVVAFAGLTGDTVTVDGVTLTEGVDWIAGTSNADTATSLATAINALDNVNASAAGAVVTVTAVVKGTAGNSITTVTGGGADLTVSGATLSGGTNPVISGRKILKNSLHSSASPNWAEHWHESGRIEVTGAANLEVVLQVRRRGAAHPQAQSVAAGSIHIRK